MKDFIRATITITFMAATINHTHLNHTKTHLNSINLALTESDSCKYGYFYNLVCLIYKESLISLQNDCNLCFG